MKTQFKLASSKLENLFFLRIDADYHEDLTFKESDVKDAINDAIFIINLLLWSVTNCGYYSSYVLLHFHLLNLGIILLKLFSKSLFKIYLNHTHFLNFQSLFLMK